MRSLLWTRLLLILVLFAALGCREPEGPPVFEISGTVNMDGKPLNEGKIVFRTVATGAFEELPIKEGLFQGKVTTGVRRVEINKYLMKMVGEGPAAGEVQENIVSEKFNLNSELTANVAPDGEKIFNFEVKQKTGTSF